MALAVIRFQGSDGGRSRFLVDVGKNRFYSYAIGDGEIQRINGLRVLKNRKYTSPLIGPVEEHSLGRAVLEVPNERFDRKNRHIQLMSFRTRRREGPAISDIEQVIEIGRGDAALPSISFGREAQVNTQQIASVPFRYRESKPPALSSALFLGTLTSMLPNILTNVLPGLLGGLGGGGSASAGSKGGGQSAGGGGSIISQLLQALKNPDMQRLIQSLIQQPAGTGNAPKTSAAQAYLDTGLALSLARPSEYSQAAIAPALLSALPALVPVLQKLLDPQTLKALNPALQGSEINLRAQQQLFEHLRQLTPSTDTPEMDQLFAELSIARGLNGADGAMEFQPVKSVHVKFAEQAPLMLGGRARLLYRYDQDVAFPLAVATPRPIRHAALQLLVKDPETLDVLVEQEYRVEEVTSGRIEVVPRLTREQLSTLTPNEEYLICALLVWQSRSRKKIGASMSQLVTLMAEYVFDRVETTDETISLNDVERFRTYWHKVWQDSFSDTIRRRLFDCKYYYALERERTSNARMETVTQTEQGGRREVSGRLKSGLILSSYALNDLLGTISPHPQLTQAELQALLSSDFTSWFNYAARTKVKFRGRHGDSAALWIFPEFRINRVVLQRAAQTNDAGHVLALAEHTVHFPMPAFARFIGVSTR